MKKRNLFLKVESTQKNVLIGGKSTVFEFYDSDDERKDGNFLEDVCTDTYGGKFDIDIDDHIDCDNENRDTCHMNDNDNSNNDTNNNVSIISNSSNIDEILRSALKDTQNDDISPTQAALLMTHSIFPCTLQDLILPTYSNSKNNISNNIILSQNNNIEDDFFPRRDSMRIAEDSSRIEMESKKKVKIEIQEWSGKEKNKPTECKEVRPMDVLNENTDMKSMMKVERDVQQKENVTCGNENKIDNSNDNHYNENNTNYGNNSSKNSIKNNANNNDKNNDSNDNNIDNNINNSNWHNGWRYECMMVEVKGPTDHLADHQLMWLNVLHRYGVTAIVGHVKETEGSK